MCIKQSQRVYENVSDMKQSKRIELHTVNFSTRMKDLARVMGESR